tara:strand:+ start:2848 stop:3291 length:444 start_codon:yes stop_codon:yes gene_type:complete
MIRKQVCGKFKTAKIIDLLPHEKVNSTHVDKLIELIQNHKFFTKPIIIDQKTRLIVDGHHRFNAAMALELSLVPVFEINYHQNRVKAFKGSLEGSLYSKDRIVKRAIARELYESKDTYHVFASKKGSLITLEDAIPKLKPVPLKKLF